MEKEIQDYHEMITEYHVRKPLDEYVSSMIRYSRKFVPFL